VSWLLKRSLAATLVSAALVLLRPVRFDPLYQVLVLAPWIAVALSAVGHWLHARRSPRWMRLAACGWGIAAATVDRLALDGAAATILFAVYAAGLIGFTVRLLPALLRRVTGSARKRTAPAFALALTLGAACLPWIHDAAEPNGDEPYYLLLSESLSRDFDLDLRNQYESGVARRFTHREIAPQPGDPVGVGGEQWSRHQWMLPLLLTPFWSVGGAIGARFAILLAWAALGERMLALLLEIGVSPRAALRGWLAALFASPLLLYSAAVWVEVPAALLVAIALSAWSRSRAGDGSGSAVTMALSLALLPLLKLRLLLLAMPLAVVILADRRVSRRRSGWLLAALALGAAAVVIVNRYTIGNALGIYGSPERWLEGQSWRDVPLRLLGLCFDPAFGLVALGPIWLLALTGFRRAVRASPVARFAMAASLPYLFAITSRQEWFGGWSPPFRYGIVLLPVLALPLGFAFDRPPSARERTLRWTLTLVSLLFGLALVAVPGWGTSPAFGRTHLFDVFAMPFRADFERFMPSAVRPRAATWLGPLAAIGLLVVALSGRRRARRLAPQRAAGWLIGLTTLWIGAAHLVPTHRVEVEDPWVVKQGGGLFPPRWMVDRTRYTGGWALARGAALEVRPVAGGTWARVSARARLGGGSSPPVELELRCGRQPVAEWRIDSAQWAETPTTEFSWCAEGTLQLLIEDHAERPNGLAIVDHIDFEWR